MREGHEKILYDMATNTIKTALSDPNKSAAHAQLWVASGMMGALSILIRSRLQSERPEIDPDLLTEFQEDDYVKLSRRWEWVAYQIGA